MRETPAYTPPEAKSEKEAPAKTEGGESELEGFNEQEFDQVGEWINSRVEQLKKVWENKEDFEGQVVPVINDILKMGIAVGFREAATGQSEEELPAQGKFVLPEEDIDKRGFWDILTSGESGWVKGDLVCKKLDRLIEKFDTWFSNKFMPPPDGQIWEKRGDKWQPKGQDNPISLAEAVSKPKPPMEERLPKFEAAIQKGSRNQ